MGPAAAGCAVGTVTADLVYLEWIGVPGGGFKPYFIGQFDEQDGRAVLVGKFTTSMWPGIVMSLWLGFVALGTLGALVAVVAGQRWHQWWGPLFGIGLFGIGIGMVQFKKAFVRDDVESLTTAIRAALGYINGVDR
jgi:hypothetical protein